MRLFIGIRPDPACVAALHETARCLVGVAPGRFLDPSLYHITLAFLGEAVDERVSAIRTAMEQAALGVAPFSIMLGAVGAFGPILFRGVKDAAALTQLSERVRAGLDALCIPYDAKPFAAHITLARDSRLPTEARNMAIPDAAFPVRSIRLFESVRLDGRLHYRSLAEVPLK